MTKRNACDYWMGDVSISNGFGEWTGSAIPTILNNWFRLRLEWPLCEYLYRDNGLSNDDEWDVWHKEYSSTSRWSLEVRVTLISAIWPAVPPAVPHVIIATIRHAAALFQQIHSYSCPFRICLILWTNRQLQHDSCGILFLFPWKHSVNDQKTCCQQMIWGDSSRQWITHMRYRNQLERRRYKIQ